ncbi:MAG: GNAT family N-acetyltransferase [Turicibacter sp.]
MRYVTLEEKHLNQLATLYVAAFNSEPWNDEWTTETAYKRLAQMLNCEGFDGLVAYQGDDMVGMILGNHEYYYNGMQFHVKEFCVDLNRRGEGIGPKLINEFIVKLQSKGIHEVILMTSRTEATEGFYQKLGFQSYNQMVMMGKKVR